MLEIQVMSRELIISIDLSAPKQSKIMSPKEALKERPNIPEVKGASKEARVVILSHFAKVLIR